MKRVFNDKKIIGSSKSKEENIQFVIDELFCHCARNEIKDIMVIARLKDETPGPEGLPQNVLNYISVDSQYEITVFNKFASDLLFNRLGEIVESDTVKAIMEMSPDGQIYIKKDKKER